MCTNVYIWSFLSICLSLCPSDLLCASCLKFQRNRRIRRHPELIDFPKTWAQNMTIYESTRDKCCVCLSGKHIFLLFPFWKYGFGRPPITGSVFSSCCAKNYSMLLFLCWSIWLYLLLCFVLCGEKPQCVLFVMGARGRGRCVFNYHLVEWLMVRQSSTELQLRVCVCVCVCVRQLWLCLYVC